ncbi:MAG TPA: hypothetical protein VGD37_25975 [Kofleriaceae bacterium]|jgi:hypothetical protein
MKLPGICIALATLATAPAGCGTEPPGAPDEDLTEVNQADTASATWGNPIISAAAYPSDCRPTGVVDRGISGGEHFFEFYGDFRCGHSSSFPTPLYSWQCGVNGSSVTARTTFTGTFQVNSAFTVPFEPFARCFVTISSWNQIAALYELII